MKHTPEPWTMYNWSQPKTDKLITVGIYTQEFPKGHEIGQAFGHSEEEAFANARLMTAGPEMLMVVKEYYNFLKNSPLEYEEDFEHKDYIRDLIKKATE